ncbi:MAG: nuclear transport factor 2 family protein [Amaricoccus sp.]
MDDNIRTVRDLYAAFARGDVPFILARLTDDARFENSDSPELPHGGVYAGKDGVARFFDNIAGAFEVTGFDPADYRAAGDEVFAFGSWSCIARATGKPFTAQWAMRFRLDGDKVAFAHVYEDTAVTAAALRK